MGLATELPSPPVSSLFCTTTTAVYFSPFLLRPHVDLAADRHRRHRVVAHRSDGLVHGAVGLSDVHAVLVRQAVDGSHGEVGDVPGAELADHDAGDGVDDLDVGLGRQPDAVRLGWAAKSEPDQVAGLDCCP